MACPWTVHEFWPVHGQSMNFGLSMMDNLPVHGLQSMDSCQISMDSWTGGGTGHGQSMDKSKNLAGAYTKARSPQKVMDSPWTVHGCPAEYAGEC